MEKVNSVKTVSGAYSVALHCSAQAQPRPMITWTRRRQGWVKMSWTSSINITCFVCWGLLSSWNVDVWHSDFTQWIVGWQLIYLLIASLHCDCNQKPTERRVYFWTNPQARTCCIFFFSSNFVRLSVISPVRYLYLIFSEAHLIKCWMNPLGLWVASTSTK